MKQSLCETKEARLACWDLLYYSSECKCLLFSSLLRVSTRFWSFALSLLCSSGVSSLVE